MNIIWKQLIVSRLRRQAHVCVILNVPTLKDGSGKELRRLHDAVQQHLRALRSMGYEPSGPFITSVLELKLDTNTMFEWQKHSQDCVDVPHYQELLNFIDLRAQASESSVSNTSKKQSKDEQLPIRRLTNKSLRRLLTRLIVTLITVSFVNPISIHYILVHDSNR